MSATTNPSEASLELTDSLRTAIDHAFSDARECIEQDGGMVPFSIICTSDGFVSSEHGGADVDAVYESVRALLAREMPESYVFCYDGYVELDTGRAEAIIAEVAKRGDDAAYLLAEPYEVREDGSRAFTEGYASAGEAEPLYPVGTKPIVSGLVQLAAERRAAADGE